MRGSAFALFFQQYHASSERHDHNHYDKHADARVPYARAIGSGALQGNPESALDSDRAHVVEYNMAALSSFKPVVL